MTVIPFPAAAPNPDELIAERRVLELRACLSRGLLLAARRGGKVTWTRGKKGTAWYRLADVDRYIRQQLERQCPGPGLPPSSNSADTGSGERRESAPSMPTGMTPELATHAIEYFQREQTQAATRWIAEMMQEREQACKYALAQIEAQQ